MWFMLLCDKLDKNLVYIMLFYFFNYVFNVFEIFKNLLFFLWEGVIFILKI